MDASQAIDLGREAIMMGLVVLAPILVVGVVVALVVGLLQAVTQIQDQTISFVPKIIAMMAALSFCLPWLVERMVEYSKLLITSTPAALLGL